jgi:hypothetical protein
VKETQNEENIFTACNAKRRKERERGGESKKEREKINR